MSLAGTIDQYLQKIGDAGSRYALQLILRAIGDRYSTCVISGSPGLVIKAGGGVLVKAGNALTVMCGGVLVTKAANTDMAALSGTVTNAKFNIFSFFIDAAGTLTSAMGVEGATLAAVKFPPTPEKKCWIGSVIINPTGAGNFVGNTTALDDAGVVPNAAYMNDTNGADPQVLIS